MDKVDALYCDIIGLKSEFATLSAAADTALDEYLLANLENKPIAIITQNLTPSSQLTFQ
jgi:hypothetical protein